MDLFLKLILEEYKFVKLLGNILLNGSVGIGKIMVVLYRMF